MPQWVGEVEPQAFALLLFFCKGYSSETKPYEIIITIIVIIIIVIIAVIIILPVIDQLVPETVLTVHLRTSVFPAFKVHCVLH